MKIITKALLVLAISCVLYHSEAIGGSITRKWENSNFKGLRLASDGIKNQLYPLNLHPKVKAKSVELEIIVNSSKFGLDVYIQDFNGLAFDLLPLGKKNELWENFDYYVIYFFDDSSNRSFRVPIKKNSIHSQLNKRLKWEDAIYTGDSYGYGNLIKYPKQERMQIQELLISGKGKFSITGITFAKGRPYN